MTIDSGFMAVTLIVVASVTGFARAIPILYLVEKKNYLQLFNILVLHYLHRS